MNCDAVSFLTNNQLAQICSQDNVGWGICAILENDQLYFEGFTMLWN